MYDFMINPKKGEGVRFALNSQTTLLVWAHVPNCVLFSFDYHEFRTLHPESYHLKDVVKINFKKFSDSLAFMKMCDISYRIQYSSAKTLDQINWYVRKYVQVGG